jgi:hypothetical protein
METPGIIDWQGSSDELWLTFRKYSDEAEARELTDLLTENKIPFEIENTPNLDIIYTNRNRQQEYRVKLQQQNFEKAEYIWLENTKAQLGSMDKDYYLFSFSNEELMDVVRKRDEWSALDFLLAQKLLKERGMEVNPGQLAEFQKERLKELAVPEQRYIGWIIAGYFVALLGGLLAVAMGWIIFSTKKTLPGGDQVYLFSEKDRSHGRNIFYLGILFFLFWMTIMLRKFL